MYVGVSELNWQYLPSRWHLQFVLEVLGRHHSNTVVDAILGDAFQELVVRIP